MQTKAYLGMLVLGCRGKGSRARQVSRAAAPARRSRPLSCDGSGRIVRLQSRWPRARNFFQQPKSTAIASTRAAAPACIGSRHAILFCPAALADCDILLSYDRLANGNAGPPGPWGSVDAVFAMTVTVSVRGGQAGRVTG